MLLFSGQYVSQGSSSEHPRAILVPVLAKNLKMNTESSLKLATTSLCSGVPALRTLCSFFRWSSGLGQAPPLTGVETEVGPSLSLRRKKRNFVQQSLSTWTFQLRVPGL